MHKNSIIKLFFELRKLVFSIILFIVFPVFLYSQINSNTPEIDKGIDLNTTDTTIVPTKTAKDSTTNANLIDTEVIYSATDSIVLSRDSKRVYLYKKAKIEYGDIILEADYIEYDQENNIVFARGVEDSLGSLIGKPVFTEKGDKFDAKTIKYNFKTKKGYIEEVFTEEEDGYLHSQITKKMDNNDFLMKNGKYTTCDNPEHPHFYLSMTKAKVIPGDKIISGYSYLVLADLPLKFVFVPFGYFPSQKDQSSGIIVPKYGEETRRGFFLQDGGYYFGFSDKMDLSITGDIFSKGSWGGDLRYRYIKRYKFNSNLNLAYSEFITSEKGLIDYKKIKNIKVAWTHSQDAKANPNSKFGASVNYTTTAYDSYNSKTIEELNTNTKSSSISYSKSWPGSPFRFSADLRHSQNSKNKSVDLTFPIMTFNMDRRYPFRRKNVSGDLKWYEDIEISYKSKLENRLSTPDSIFLVDTKWSDFEYGFQHSIPLSTNIKILKYFNLSPQVEYTGVLYQNYILKDYNYNEGNGVVDTDTINKINYAHMVTPSISLSVGPNIYGMYAFKNPNAKIVAIRHVLTPSVSISYRPDLGEMVSKYYADYEYGPDRNKIEYSKFENGLYKLPATPGESSVISFGLNNNLEMKVRSDKDTITGTRKIKLIEGLKLSTSYDVFADSLNWSPIGISGRTTLFKDKVNINVSATVDPYAIDSLGVVYNEFYWNVSDDKFLGKIGRLESFRLSIDFRLNSEQGKESEDKNNTESREEIEDKDLEQKIQQHQQQFVGYVDFDVPWDLSVNYNYNYSKPKFEDSKKIAQTVGISGNLSLTKNWKISFRTNYDITNKELSSTSINIHRDLHCWEMSFGWIPIGRMQSYNFQINVKASTLKDLLKLPKKRTWQENL